MDIPPEPQPPSPEDAPPPPYPGQKPLAEQNTVAGQGPYPGAPGQDPYSGQDPYPGQTPYPGQASYAGPPAYPGGQSPYAGQGPYPGQSPLPGQAPGYPGQAPGYPGQGPYPGPGAPAFGYPAQGWYVDRTTNGLAIASLVTSLAAACVPFLGLLLGIFGLRQIRRTGQQGRGMAVAGIVISSLATAGMALGVTLGVLGAFDTGNTEVTDLQAGQCFNTVGTSLAGYEGGSRSTTVDVVSCEEEHDAEAYRVFVLGPEAGNSYPGVDRISDVANQKCSSYAQDYLGDASLADGMDIYFFLPPRAGWNRGDHSVTCFFGHRDGKVTGSVREGTSEGDNADYGV